MSDKHWTEYFRIITPITLLLISTLIGMSITNQNDIKTKLTGMEDKICSIDGKMFIHLTNAEIHIPRSTVVSRDEFSLYQTMRDKQMNDLKELLTSIKDKIDGRNNSQKN